MQHRERSRKEDKLTRSDIRSSGRLVRSRWILASVFPAWLFCFFSPVFADTMSTSASPEFTVQGASLWAPEPGTAGDGFREDLFNFQDAGTLESVIGIDLTATTADYQGEPFLACPEGTFPSSEVDGFQPGDPFELGEITVDTGCYSCPTGYEHNPALPANVEGVCFKIGSLTRASLKGEPEWFCPSDQIISLVPQGCYSCPAGYEYQDGWPVTVEGACIDKETATKGRAVGCSGSEFPDLLLQKCYSCPDGYSHDASKLATSSSVCRRNRTADYERDTTIPWICPAGEFPNAEGSKCYSCPSGYSHDASKGVNTSGVCYKTTSADYEHAYQCAGTVSEFDGLNGYCYGCDDGYRHNSLLTVNTPGVCYANDTAERESDITFVCPENEFYDVISGRCAGCAEGYRRSALPADVPGACYRQEDRTAEYQGQISAEGCDTGEFFDLVTGKCYSCPDGATWNPLTPVGEDGACVGLAVVDRENADFLAGMELDYDYQYRLGAEGGIAVDEGSVDVDYRPRFEIEIAENTARGPGHYIISTRQVADETELTMSSTWPGVSMWYDNYIDNYNKLDLRVYYPRQTANGSWEQAVDEQPVWDTSSGGEHNFAYYLHDDENMKMLEFYVGADGIDFSMMGLGLGELIADGLVWPDLFDLPPVRAGGLFDPPLEVTETTFKNLAKKFKKEPDPVPKPLIEVGSVLLEGGIGTPDLFTPERTDPPYLGEYTQELKVTGSAEDTSIRQKIHAGERTGVEFLALNSGLKDPDVLRTDVDVDGFVTISSGYFTGKKISMPTKVPLVDYWSLNLSALDVDAGAIFHFDKDIEFQPNASVELRFSERVRVQKDIPDAAPEWADSLRLPIGTDLFLFYPGGRLDIGTRYSLEDNRFTNDSNLLLTPLAEGEILSAHLKILGVPKTVLPKATLVQLTAAWPEPINVVHVSQYGEGHRSVFPLVFDDVAGETLSVTYGPVASCLDGSVMLDASGEAALVAEDYFFGDAGVPPPITLSLDRETLYCRDIGTAEVIVTVEDGNGAMDSCSAFIGVSDTLGVCSEYRVSLTVAGLFPGESALLQLNGGSDLYVAEDGRHTFTQPVYEGSSYDVSVLDAQLEPDRSCRVYDGTGTIVDQDVDDVLVVCAADNVPEYDISFTVAGLLENEQVTLRNIGLNIVVARADGEYTFSAPMQQGDTYHVELIEADLGPGRACFVHDGYGTVDGDVSDIEVLCDDAEAFAIPVLGRGGIFALVLLILGVVYLERVRP